MASKRRSSMVTRALVALAAFVGLVCVALVVLRLAGLLIPYSVPTASMAPAINAGDSFVMERFTYLKRKPACGDILVFKTDGFTEAGHFPGFKMGEIFVKRLVGVPGDHLRLANGVLYVNDQAMSFHNRAGEIHYVHLPSLSRYLANDSETVVVPADCYFVLGDNSAHSADSRFYGFLSTKAVSGRAAFCYWPPKYFGSIQ